MKKLILIIMSLAIQVCYSQSIKVEAESLNYMDMILDSDSLASDGSFLKMDSTGTVTWIFQADSSQWYNLTIGYQAFDGDKEEILKLNEKVIPIGFGRSEEWNEFSKAIFLEKGIDSISISPSWGYINLDYLSLNPIKLAPALLPKNQHIYNNYTHDIFYKINLNGNNLEDVKINGKSIDYEIENYPFQQQAIEVKIPKSVLEELSLDSNKVEFYFKNEYKLTSLLCVETEPINNELKIIVPYVEHGASVLAILPTGKKLLIDTGKDWVRDSILFPFFKANDIDTIDYFFITHYHNDHDAGDSGKTTIQKMNIKNVFDYRSFASGGKFTLEGVNFTILNSFTDGEEENTRSLSFKMEYNSFTYIHGADIYAINQKKITERFPNDLECNLYYGNHHFHGSVDVEYLKSVNPALFVFQSQEAIYARDAYSNKFMKQVIPFLQKNSTKFIESLPALEVGTIVVRINSGAQWNYETYYGNNNLIPYLLK